MAVNYNLPKLMFLGLSKGKEGTSEEWIEFKQTFIEIILQLGLESRKRTDSKKGKKERKGGRERERKRERYEGEKKERKRGVLYCMN
jgi:hypothetical protein